MSAFALPVQTALYSQLSGATSATVYDDVPDIPPGMPEASFPYIVLGEDALLPWNTDDMLGNTVVATLHIYSRYSGKKETKQIMQEIYTALNRRHNDLSATGYRFVDCLFDSGTIMELGDGKTRHGIVRYRITIEKE